MKKKHHDHLHLPWEARHTNVPGSNAWVIWGHFPENEVQVSSLETGIGIKMPPERPLFTIYPAEGINPEKIAKAVAAASMLITTK